MTKPRVIFLSFLLIQLLLPTRAVFADTGPKPTMEFTFKQESDGESVTIVSGILYECEQSDCSDAAPLGEFGPQRFTCDSESCSALAYGFAPYHKIKIEFSDGKMRASNIFQTAGFNSKYTVTVRPDDLLVESQLGLSVLPRIGIIVLLCVCVLVIGGLVLGLIFFLLRRRLKS